MSEIRRTADLEVKPDRLLGANALLCPLSRSLRAVARHGRLDVIVNIAAVGQGGRLTDTTWHKVMAVNLSGMFYGCRAAARQMLTQNMRDEVRRRIVNISSQHGMIASPNHLAYGVSKSGVVYMTRQIAADYARDGIVCNAVTPARY